MMKKMYRTLEFDKVMQILEDHALSDKVKAKIQQLEPYMSEAEVSRHMNETTEGKLIIENYGNPPLSSMAELGKIISLAGKSALLLPDQLGMVATFLTSCRRLKNYLKKAESVSEAVASYGNSIYPLSELEDEIYSCIRGNQLDDKASPQLADIRRKISNGEMQVKAKLDSLLRNNKIWFSEGFVAIRNGHYTLPVKRECKSYVSGTIIDMSQSGSTYFIEPSAARKLQEEIALLQVQEENEVRRILYTLTGLVEEYLPYININIEAMESLDFIFAKAKLSLAMKASPLPILEKRKIVIKNGRHPLLKAETAVPLNFEVGEGTQGIIITGPNTGGKTVALKTIGLLSIMAQSGLHVPAEDGCFTMNNYVLCDIGDGQSITENLSTFSSHLTNIIQILSAANAQSLVLLDELGSGTDPAEGMGLAIAILEELRSKYCLFVATTHYPEIKEFAKAAPGLTNARMAFDRQSLLPLYQLEIGEAGESCALYIAKRLGLPQSMIDRASAAAYGRKAAPLPQVNIADFSSETITRKHKTKTIPENSRSMKFNIGDSVIIYPQKIIGIVYQKANEKGEIGIQIKKKKQLINHKRLKLHVPASELYPEDYDFSIIFDTVANRKARKIISHKHDPNVVIETNESNKN